MDETVYTEAEARALMDAYARAGSADVRQPQSRPLTTLIEDGVRQLGFVDHIYPEGRSLRTPKAAASNGALSFVETIKLDGGGRGVINLKAGEATEIDPLAVARDNSMVARAGANIVVIDKERSPALWDYNANAALQTAIGRVVLPATFEAIADGASTTVQTKPVSDALFALSDLPAYATQFTISRAERRSLGGDTLADAVTAGVMRGIGQLIDTVALNAVAAATPSAFSFGSLAALHLGVDDVSAIIGTGVASATVWPDGTFRSSQGLPARLTAGHAGSFAGVWPHAIVVLYPEIRLLANRLNVVGDLNIITFVNVKAVLPHPGSFWTVS
jgi:hypothetical protein